jgi:hypothetical protein
VRIVRGGTAVVGNWDGSSDAESAAAEDQDEVDWMADFVCSSCGRSDLPETGDWDPPICLECDAAINHDALFPP